MRIIGGSHRGRSLLSPEGRESRPPLAIIRKVIFDSLWWSPEGLEVLDLFAGSGSMGLEALSRGAGSCVFVDGGREACSVISGNLTKLGLENGEVLRCQYPEAFDRIRGRSFGLIFADPPFESARDGRCAGLEERCAAALAKDGILVVRHPADAPDPSPTPSLRLVKTKSHGLSVTRFYERTAPAKAALDQAGNPGLRDLSTTRGGE